MSAIGVEQHIYTGFWTDWTDGPVLGSTLTVTSRTGAYLVAFLALYVHYAGGSIWSLACIFIFRAAAKPNLVDASRLQRQAVLRNSSSPLNTLLTLGSRKRIRAHWKLACLAAVNLAAIFVAGIFSSKVTQARSNVLLTPSYCGNINSSITDPQALSIISGAATKQTLNDWAASSQYAALCSGNSSVLGSCPLLAPHSPSWKISRPDSCPFGELCVDNASVMIDSGYLDSHYDFGINTAPEDRIAVRIALQCAPLVTDGFEVTYDRGNISKLPAVDKEPSALLTDGYELIRSYSYGPALELLTGNITWGANVTFVAGERTGDDLTSFSPNSYSDGLAYDATAIVYYANATTGISGFLPIPELTVPDQDSVIIFLSNYNLYTGPVTDPWFSATYPTSCPTADGSTCYEPSNLVSAMSCTQKTQFCRQDDLAGCVNLPSGFSSLSPIYGTDPFVESLNLTPRQSGIAYRLQWALQSASFSQLSNTGILPKVLLASQQGFGGALLVKNPLPDNQWILELQNWLNVMLTQIQSGVIQYVSSPSDSSLTQYLVKPSDTDEWMCHNQIIQRADYASFNVFGLCMILVVGGLFVLLNILLVPVIDKIRKDRPSNQYRGRAWKSYELLHLYRAAAGSKSFMADDVNASDRDSEAGNDSSAEDETSKIRLVTQSRL